MIINFFKKHSYSAIKMFLNQFAMSVFGIMLTLAISMSSGTENNTLLTISSVFSILFYIFLLYTMTWELAAKERIRADAGRGDKSPWMGLFISLTANIPNILLAIFITIGYAISQLFDKVEALASAGGFLYGTSIAISRLLQGMYTGVLIFFNGKWVEGKLENPIWYFLIIIPAVAISAISYYLSFKYSPNMHKKKH